MEKFLDDNEFLKKVFDAIPCLIFIVDSDVRIQHLNATAKTRLGTSKEYVYKKRGGEVLHCILSTAVKEGCGWSSACPSCVVRNSVTKAIGGNSVTQEYTRMELQKDGTTSEIHLLISTAPFKYDGSDYAILTMEDITDLRALKVVNRELNEEVEQRQAAEKKLSVEKELLSTVFHHIGDGVIAADGDGRVVLMNESAEILTGWPLEDAKGRPLNGILRLTDGRTGAPCEDPQKTIMNGTIKTSIRHALITGRQGAERAITASGAFIHDREGNAVEQVVVLRDVSDKLKLEAETVRAKAFQSVGVLAGGIAHDFNNLLSIIMANLSLAKKGLSPADERYEYLALAKRACGNAKDLTYELLSVSRGGEPVKKTMSVAGLIAELEIFSVNGSPWKGEFTAGENLWPVEADSAQITQLLNNLMENAVESMPGGGTVTVTAENVVITPKDNISVNDGKFVKISVKDSGHGIPEKYLDRIFDPYFTTKKKGTTRGTGLGLAICYSIIHRHDGHITVESKPGEGSAFHVYLPACGTETTGAGRGA